MAQVTSGQTPAVLQSCILSSASTELVQDEVSVKVKWAFFLSGANLTALKLKYWFTKVKYCLTSDFVGERRIKCVIKYRLGQNAAGAGKAPALTTSLGHTGKIYLVSLISNLLWNLFPWDGLNGKLFDFTWIYVECTYEYVYTNVHWF